MSYELTGKLIEKNDTVQRTETFRIREFVVEQTDENNGRTFTSYIKFQCTQDRTSILDRVQTGEQVKVYFNIKGSKSERDGKVSYWTNLDAWRIESALDAAKHQVPVQESYTDMPAGDTDDLPF
ncbi:MAG TPA: DUF3127 domain-containing protein [Ferruginibacter sp.]|nr:hypothetical protein [Chitinophagaceae bacterium]HML57044.1 DUF3127 domain-containing protein [Ferruginibacter sp.]HRN91587.1 DUF3127 domain-containing protein [Ferruginibacter sp.]HRO05071.1 DUF3127 domain-containing protein [Ferruginibacter sp.]HRO95624.1 DUF3127 domain-containing protein [Ferruginibacter sp.]